MYLKTTKMADLPTVKTLAVPLCEEAHTCVPRALCSFPGWGGFLYVINSSSVSNQLVLKFFSETKARTLLSDLRSLKDQRNCLCCCGYSTGSLSLLLLPEFQESLPSSFISPAQSHLLTSPTVWPKYSNPLLLTPLIDHPAVPGALQASPHICTES